MKKLFLIIVLCYSCNLFAQNRTGALELGMRNTFSLFGNSSSNSGIGYGGHFRLKLADKLNTEWYADYITTNISNKGKRVDAHIGWSVMFYLMNEERQKGTFTPYLLGGHCFDYTKISSFNKEYYSLVVAEKLLENDRWSTAVHLGIGTHYNISSNFDISLAAQYMNHLGNTLHYHTDSDYLYVDQQTGGLSLEGHLLISASLNMYITKLWKK